MSFLSRPHDAVAPPEALNHVAKTALRRGKDGAAGFDLEAKNLAVARNAEDIGGADKPEANGAAVGHGAGDAGLVGPHTAVGARPAAGENAGD